MRCVSDAEQGFKICTVSGAVLGDGSLSGTVFALQVATRHEKVIHDHIAK